MPTMARASIQSKQQKQAGELLILRHSFLFLFILFIFLLFVYCCMCFPHFCFDHFNFDFCFVFLFTCLRFYFFLHFVHSAVRHICLFVFIITLHMHCSINCVITCCRCRWNANPCNFHGSSLTAVAQAHIVDPKCVVLIYYYCCSCISKIASAKSALSSIEAIAVWRSDRKSLIREVHSQWLSIKEELLFKLALKYYIIFF